MGSTIITIIVAVATLIIGLVIGKILFTKNSQKLIDDAQQHADRLIKEAEIQAETIKEKKKTRCKRTFSSIKIRT
ncbi:MAG: ribonuclease [Bacteroidetes bacterium OLB11]|nr:MAG: ribonuclease [Bacteroidetes bacterium OLB11]